MAERKYRHPPIVEVICEFRFKPSTPWDLIVPGLIYEKVKKVFPHRRPLKQIGTQFQLSPGEVAFQLLAEEGIRFLRDDERAFIQLRPRRISIHHLAPYPHWEGFKPLIAQGYHAYMDALPEAELQRIGLRYINRIQLSPYQLGAIREYFTIHPELGPGLSWEPTSFGVFLFFPFEGGKDGLHLRLEKEPSSTPETANVILDLDYFTVQREKSTWAKALEWVEQAHQHILQVFEGTITDRLREQLDREG
ncbi:MAG: TIGR04255 family protein [Anaerolineae bacterium]|nr:TIGR04255 family protein [Anaerolineae bacterium]